MKHDLLPRFLVNLLKRLELSRGILLAFLGSMMAWLISRISLRIASMALVATLAACIVSPVPQPPNVEPELDETALNAEPCANCDISNLTFTGSPGAVSARGDVEDVVIWIVNLSTDSPPQTFPVEADGSFQATPLGEGQDAFRLQARLDGVSLRSDPLDLMFDTSDMTVTPIEHPLEDCFIVTPAPELEFLETVLGATATIELRNECDEELIFDRLELRAPSDAFAITGGQPSISMGESFLLNVELTTADPGPQETVLIIDVSGPASDSRAITIISL